MSLLTVYPDQPYDMKPVLDPYSELPLIEPQDTWEAEIPNAKDLWLLEKVQEKIAKHERVVVYTSWVRIDTQDRLEKSFREHGINACVLRSTVPTAKREEWIEKQVENGVNVLITNPQLLETGLDLNDFTTLIYYNISYKLFTLRQSSRRSWRINQRAPRIEVYFLYFRDVMQHRAIRLMASKLVVAGVIEGNLTDEGLAAMSECQDLTTLLAQELTLGLKNETEDIGDVFKKMAFLKTEESGEDVIEGEATLLAENETDSVETAPVETEETEVKADEAEKLDEAHSGETEQVAEKSDNETKHNVAEKPPTTDQSDAIAKPKARSSAETEKSTAKSDVAEKSVTKPDVTEACRTVVVDVSARAAKPRSGTKKATVVIENQISLFDILDETA